MNRPCDEGERKQNPERRCYTVGFENGGRGHKPRKYRRLLENGKARTIIFP